MIAAATETISLGNLLGQGGWPMVPIYACSVVALAVFLHKLFGLVGAKLSDLSWLPRVIEAVRQGEFERAAEGCSGSSHPATRVVAAAAVALRDRPDRVEAEARRVGSLELQRMEKNLSLLSFLAQASPLLGLLGTVLGHGGLVHRASGEWLIQRCGFGVVGWHLEGAVDHCGGIGGCCAHVGRLHISREPSRYAAHAAFRHCSADTDRFTTSG